MTVPSFHSSSDSDFDKIGRNRLPSDTEPGIVEEPDSARPLREGLPPGFRMRHDPHYVDALIGAPRSAEHREVAAGLATAALDAAARELAETLAGLARVAGELPRRQRPLRERVAAELLRAEAQRAASLAQAVGVLATEPAVSLAPVDLAALLRAAIETMAFEARLTGSGPSLYVPPGPCQVKGDARLLATAFEGILVALAALVGDGAGEDAIHVRIAPATEGAVRTIDFVQHVTTLPRAALTRFFDAGWTDHPAGRTSGIRLSAARRIAALHGGRLDVSASDGGGCRLTVTVSATDRA